MGLSADQGIDVLAQFAEDVVRKAGNEALRFYGKGASGVTFDERLVTEAELHLEDFFQDVVRSRFPGHSIFQDGQIENEYSHSGRRYLWVFDALDGVSNFQAGIPIWGISLALLENFWPLLGIFYMPVTGDLFHARAGDKAFWRSKEIHVTDGGGISDESILLTFSRFHNHYRSQFPGKILNLGCSGAHICYVAKSRAVGAVLSKGSYQGLAATRIILEAAGGKLHRMDGSEVFLNEYMDGRKFEDHFLVTAPQNWTQIRRYLT
jgi:myo-inositol-1(or 4)-monophosphatase